MPERIHHVPRSILAYNYNTTILSNHVYILLVFLGGSHSIINIPFSTYIKLTTQFSLTCIPSYFFVAIVLVAVCADGRFPKLLRVIVVPPI